MLTVFFSDCRKVTARTNTEKAVKRLHTIAQLRWLVLCVVGKGGILRPVYNRKDMLVQARTFDLANIRMVEGNGAYPWILCWLQYEL